MQLKNLFKFNKKKLIIEFIGNPGCGKSTIINKLKSINKSKNKDFSLLNKRENRIYKFLNFLNFTIIYFIPIIKSWAKLISIRKIFYSKSNEKSIFNKIIRLKKLSLILLNTLFKIYDSKSNIIFVESIMHQIIKNDFEINFLLKTIRKIYWGNNIQFVFVKCPYEESLKRMKKRGENVFLENKIILDRYKSSNETQNFLFCNCKNEYFQSRLKYKPIIIDCNKEPYINAKEIIRELNI